MSKELHSELDTERYQRYSYMGHLWVNYDFLTDFGGKSYVMLPQEVSHIYMCKSACMCVCLAGVGLGDIFT